MQSDKNDKKYWHNRTSQQAISEFDSSQKKGLTEEEAGARLKKYGKNELIEQRRRGIGRMLWEQITATMVLILIIAAIVSMFLQHWLEAISIIAIVVLFAILGFIQEYRAEKAMAALKKMAKPLVRVIRSGNLSEISSTDIVPGDLVVVENGNIIPADCRLLESHNLKVQEAALTGESEAVLKQTDKLDKEDIPLGDRLNMIYMGTIVTQGRGIALVTDTGMNTELGSIATLLQDVKSDQTPLQKRLDNVGKILAIAGGIIAFLIALFGVLSGESIGDMFLVAISVAVAIVPEGLPAVVTVTLAIGARRMLARNALIRKLPAVETLGSVTDICSDKTGTLTQNKMTVTFLATADEIIPLEYLEQSDTSGKGGDKNLLIQSILLSGALCNDATLSNGNEEDESEVIGDPTETAIVVAARKFGLDKRELEKAFPRLNENPFDSDRKRMTTFHDFPVSSDKYPLKIFNHNEDTRPEKISFTKGSFDGLLELSSHVIRNNQMVPVTEEIKDDLSQKNREFASKGIRVLGVAYRTYGKDPDPEEAEHDLILLGLIGMIDPPREEVKLAVEKCKQAGIRPIMITGDHPLTASYIARKLNISQNENYITGIELAKLSEKELRKKVEEVSVYARVSPEHKLRIVKVLQQNGHVVAMTGDGVNDAPALKQADIGVAMGITGTDVSKEASDMVLRDDNFATIVAAVEEGRVIYDNIRKFVKFSIAGNLGKVLVMIFVPLITMINFGSGLEAITIPLLPLQLLWLNLLTDGLLGVGLGVEPAETFTMRRPPIPPKSNIFSEGVGGQILRTGILIGMISIVIGIYAWSNQDVHWQTMMFSGIAFAQMWQALATRSFKDSIFKTGLFSNIPIVILILLVFALQISAIYVPFLQVFLTTDPLTLTELLLCIAISSIVLIESEIEKALIH
ncbi:MAG: cation-translocating P-type ATPase [Cyclobacteriaceae bacterium]|nr:cation-translocating P-type ATPase [Cyclobacteriaceae bacterium]